jgi:circadian clock protein KaiB
MKTNPAGPDSTAAFEQTLAELGEGRYVLRLYLTGHTNRSLKAVQAVKTLCEQYLKGRFDLEVVDLCEQPDRAQVAQIIAAPTLVKELPLPLRRLIGDLTNTDRVLIALDLKPRKECDQ